MTNRYAIPLTVVALTTLITGSAWAAPRIAPLAIATCAGSAACLSASNASTGPGILGATTAGTGVRGVTSGTSATAGVYGSASSSGTGVAGTSSSSYGIEGRSLTSNGIFATSAGSNPAVSGSTTAAATGFGVEGVATKGTGVKSLGLQAFAGVGQFASQANTGYLLTLINSQGLVVFQIDQAGDLLFTGPEIACARAYIIGNSACGGENKPPAANAAPARATLANVPGAGGSTLRVVRYGQAGVIGGFARVALDPSLARALAPGRPYHVFLSDAETSGGWLDVAAKTPGGFVVREHGGGRSSITFGYRIVADVVPVPSSSIEKPL